MDIKQLIGEATEYDKKGNLKRNVRKVGAKALAHLQTALGKFSVRRC